MKPLELLTPEGVEGIHGATLDIRIPPVPIREGDTVEETALLARREEYAAEAPAGVLVLTAGVDVQDDRLEVEVVGWGMGEESWAIDYRVLWGDPGRDDVRIGERRRSRGLAGRQQW